MFCLSFSLNIKKEYLQNPKKPAAIFRSSLFQVLKSDALNPEKPVASFRLFLF